MSNLQSRGPGVPGPSPVYRSDAYDSGPEQVGTLRRSSWLIRSLWHLGIQQVTNNRWAFLHGSPRQPRYIAGCQRRGGSTSRVAGQTVPLGAGVLFGNAELRLELWNVIAGL